MMKTENTYIQRELDTIIEKILNDQRIFSPLYGIKLFDNKTWSDLKEFYNKKDKNGYYRLIDRQCRNAKRIYQYKGIKDTTIIDGMCLALKDAYYKKPSLLDKLFCTLRWYGPVKCNLPDLEESILYIWKDGLKGLIKYIDCRSKRARGCKKRALYAFKSYIYLLNKENIPLYCIEYLVRKVNILTNYWFLIYE